MSNEKTQHTPEPWAFTQDDFEILSGEVEIANLWTADGSQEQRRANAARIVQCVNAMRNIDNPEQFIFEALTNKYKQRYEKGIAKIHKLTSERDELLKQRDELLKTLESISEMEPITQAKTIDCFYLARKSAHEAISNAKPVIKQDESSTSTRG